MIVHLRPLGALEGYLGSPRLAVELQGEATLRDLLQLVDARWGMQLPERLWDRAAKRFRGPVLIMSAGVDLRDPATPLADQQEIILAMPLAGG